MFFRPSCWEAKIIFQQIPTGVEEIEGLLHRIAVYTSQDVVCCICNARPCSEEYCTTRDPIYAQLMALPWSTTLFFSPAWLFDLASLFWIHFLQRAGAPSHLVLGGESPWLSLDTASPWLKGEQTFLKTWMWTRSHSSGEPIPVLCSMHGLRLLSASSCPYNPGRPQWNQLLCLWYWILPSLSHAQRSSKLKNPGISSFVPELRLVIRSSSSR